MFTTDGGGAATFPPSLKAPWRSPALVSANMSEDVLRKHVLVSKYKTGHALKWACRIAIIVMILWLLLQIVYIPTAANEWRDLITGRKKLYVKNGFGQRENLQWLGASTDVVRGDYENNQDSLAEKALKRDTTVTNMTPKAKFSERLSSPEEDLMKKMGA